MKSKSMYNINKLSPFWNTIISALLVIFALLTVFPVLLVISISFSSAKSIANNGYNLFPEQYSFEAYNALFKMGNQIMDSYIVTIAHTVIGTVLSLFVMSMFAFALSQKKFRARRVLTFLTFFTMLFSGGLVPSYIITVRYLHLYDSFWVLVLPGLVSAFNVIILRTFITTTIPDSMLEAARIDGANDFRIFWQIVLPLFKAGLATIGLFNVVSRWNDWFTGMLYIQNPKLVPLQTLLTKIQANVDYLNQNIGKMGGMSEAIKYLPTESARMAITIVSVLPIMLIYPFFQKYFIKGLTIGSVKG